MKTATVADLRKQFARLSRWIEEGESIEITKRGRLFAKIVPASPVPKRHVSVPDFAARIQAEYPHPMISPEASQALRDEMRGDR
jgi:antitoxin (DNA-binding transcriptional repressor) of toxin-antitoxin stability system